MEFKENLKLNRIKSILTFLTIPLFWKMYLFVGLKTGKIQTDIICGGTCGMVYFNKSWALLPTFFSVLIFYLFFSFLENSFFKL